MAPDNHGETTRAGRDTRRGARQARRRDHDLRGTGSPVPEDPQTARRVRHAPGRRTVTGRFARGCRLAAALLTVAACQSAPARVGALPRPPSGPPGS